MIQIDFPIHGTNRSHIYYWGIFAARGIIVKIYPGGVACLLDYSARDQKGIMKHFIPPGTKGYNQTFCAARDQIARDM
jgi:hypothetical protein